MPLPTIIIFNQHDDTIPFLLIKDLLPDLADLDYGTYCPEAPHDISFKQLKETYYARIDQESALEKQVASTLEKAAGIKKPLCEIPTRTLIPLIERFFPCRDHLHVASLIRMLPPLLIKKEIIQEVEGNAMTMIGLDMSYSNFQKTQELSLSTGERYVQILAENNSRDTIIVSNLIKLRANQEEGIILSVGTAHADGILSQLEAVGMDNVLYYFPHGASIQEDLNSVSLPQRLQGHTHCLTAEEITPFKSRIIKQIHRKIKYTQEIENNSHEQFLSYFFRTHFRAFVRQGFHVDALVSYNTPNIHFIKKQLQAVGVPTLQTTMDDDEPYLVVPNVNKRAIAKRIRTME